MGVDELAVLLAGACATIVLPMAAAQTSMDAPAALLAGMRTAAELPAAAARSTEIVAL
jgi:hypothetical protein